MDRLTEVIGGKKKISAKAIISYVLDYAIVAILAAVYALLDKIVTPYNQPFSLNNISLQYPMANPERITIFHAMLISCAFPAVIIFVYTVFLDGLFSHHRKATRTRKYTLQQRLWELNCGILGLFLAQGAAFVMTGSLKNLIGKPRPDIIARCLVPEGARDASPFGLTTSAICTQTDKYIMQDGFRSFPSGHSSSSFAGLFYLSLYLAAKLHVLDQRGEVWRTFLVLIPTLAAAVVAGSRIMDARHHPFDVLFGSALGVLCAWGSYRQYFPPVSHTWEKGRAYPMRTWGVPMRRPDGMLGTDGQVYNYTTGQVDRTANAMMRDDEEASQYGMEPVRLHQRNLSPPDQSGIDDTDYEHVRLKAGSVTTESHSPTLQNTFRDQVNKNQSLRGGDDMPEQDGIDITQRRQLHMQNRI